MPRLVKGGKHVYGWSEVGSKGMIAVPIEALEDYGLKKPCNVILFSGSVRSGGFALTNRDLLKKSHLIAISDKNPSLAEFRISEGETVIIAGKPCCWVKLKADGRFVVPLVALKDFGVNPGDFLLSVRGSRFALGFCVKGPLIDEAKKHSSLKVFK